MHEVFYDIANSGPDSFFTYAVSDGKYRWYVKAGHLSADSNYRYSALVPP